jgi:drug/metabolite transporter (DMT)-like permease
MVSFFWALTKVDASVAAMVFALSPLAVLALLALRGEKFTRRHTVRIVLGLSGVYLLIGPGGNVNWLGVGLVCLAITSYAIHLSLIQWYLRDYDARTVTLYVIAGMSITSIIFWSFQGIEWQDPGWSGWLAIISLAVVSTYLARLTMFAAIRSIGSGQIALLAPTETLLTVIWSMIFLQERLTPWQWVGGLLILTSALLAIVRLNRARWRPRWRLWPKL